MKPRSRSLVAAGAIAVVATFGGVALASGDDNAADRAEGPDMTVTGNALEAAPQTTRDDGSQVDVQPDEDFNVVGDEREPETDENDDEDEIDHSGAIANEDQGAQDSAEDEHEGPDVAITGDPLTKASAVALEAVQQELGQSGRVSATEVGDEESYYEVEVTLDDGSQVDVQLDENFNFVGFD